jgi:hypothetical protein
VRRGARWLCLALALAGLSRAAHAQTDPLPSWNDGAAKRAIVKFVSEASTTGSAGFIAPEARLAAFDNDGTLWSEQMFAFGNSDGDREMLEWTAAGDGPRFAGLVHHSDAAREWAYDRKSAIGKLDKALDEATQKGWAVVDMKSDWKVVYPEPSPE